MCSRRLNIMAISLVAVALFSLTPTTTIGAQNRASNTAAFVAQQQAEERYRRLYSIVEDLQAANLVLQQRVDRLESQLQRTLKTMEEQKADNVTTDQLEALSTKVTKELQALDKKRAEDNQKILAEFKKFANRPVPTPKPAVTQSPKPTAPPYTGPVYEVTVEAGYTISGIAQEYREQGHHISVDDILRANPGLIPERIRPGQVINVPAKQ